MVDLERRRVWSRQGRRLDARFPELLSPAEVGAVLDGEIVAVRGGRLEFGALQQSPQRRREEGVTVVLWAFDLLSFEGRSLRSLPYRQRRAELADWITTAGDGTVQLMPATPSRSGALEWLGPAWAEVGVQGVVAKPFAGTYRRGTASGWLKIRSRATTEAAVLGIARTGAVVLVLGRPGPDGALRPAGVSAPLAAPVAAELRPQLHAAGAQRWLPGALPGQDPVLYAPVEPVVVEVLADAAVDHGRWRHPVRVVRSRPDLHPGDLPPLE
ncbi:ATP-dependent DNA ligase [Saccharopolyspora cebuensis]